MIGEVEWEWVEGMGLVKGDIWGVGDVVEEEIGGWGGRLVIR